MFDSSVFSMQKELYTVNILFMKLALRIRIFFEFHTISQQPMKVHKIINNLRLTSNTFLGIEIY